MIRRTVALDSKKVAPWLLTITHGEVDAKATRTNLECDVMSSTAKRLSNLSLKRGILLSTAIVGHIANASLGVLEERLKRSHPTRGGSSEINVIMGKVGEHLTASPCARNQNVEAPLSTLPIQGPEVHRHVALGTSAVTYADKDHVALVALDALQVFHEERLIRMRRKEREK